METGRMAVEALRGYCLKAAGAVPRSLAFHIEESVMFVEPDSTRATKPACKRRRLSIGGYLHNESTIPRVGMIGRGKA